ncbi:MAG: hypothetical protein HUK26_02965 [Duodenibacillus sp.]|nr:hypothetical protein [Duodenibacillus sp.]
MKRFAKGAAAIAAVGVMTAAPAAGAAAPAVIYATVEGRTLPVELADNSSARALAARLAAGDVSYGADDYGGFEKVGDLGFALPANDEEIAVGPGDVILYQGRRLCLYYAANAWDFTRMGRIRYASAAELDAFLKPGRGRVRVTLSLRPPR